LKVFERTPVELLDPRPYSIAIRLPLYSCCQTSESPNSVSPQRL